MLLIPTNFARRIVELNGAEGETWLQHLPSLIDNYARRWDLTILPPFEPLSYNYVAPVVYGDGMDAVIKMGFPNPELLTEIEALKLFDGEGILKLFEADPEAGVLLLERLKPGVPLSSLPDDGQATSIAAQVMCQLWKPAPEIHPFPTIAGWAKGLERLRAHFGGEVGPFPKHLVELAEILFKELITSMDEPALLHGDLHHGNILSAERAPWLALDPKGVVGERAYEVGALLRNPMPELLRKPNPKDILRRRVDQLAEALGFERQRLVKWGLAQAVLAGWWSYEDHGLGWEMWITCAEILSNL